MSQSMPRPGNTLLATGFVADLPEEGTTFPSAGGNSGDPRVQAVYWRCIVALFASARFTNPEQRLALFSNVSPPVVDGHDIGAVLTRYGVELRRVPLTARLAPGATSAWGNVLYFHDIMTDLAQREDSELRIAVLDSDVLVTGSLQPLFALLDTCEFAGYVVGQTGPGDVVNGLSIGEMDNIARALGAKGDDVAEHFGGELFLTSVSAWKAHRALFDGMLRDAMAGAGPASGIITEEHIFTIAFAVLRGKVASANHLIKRIWTSPRYNTAVPGDEYLLMWHLPAEKRYGLRDFYRALRRQCFPRNMDGAALRTLAMTCCGVPNKGLGKVLHDGLRQVAAKAGLYK
ncbi:MAG: hypothetical protein KKA12_06750 [Alphaproteobacteria bacterium]|nr:hypothetical protein [Alphaproteobacteria bacterium]